MISKQLRNNNNKLTINNLQQNKKSHNLLCKNKIRLLLKKLPHKNQPQLRPRKKVLDSNLNKCREWELVDKKSILRKIWMPMDIAIPLKTNQYKTVVAEMRAAIFSEKKLQYSFKFIK